MRTESRHYFAVGGVLGIFLGNRAFLGRGGLENPGSGCPGNTPASRFHLGLIKSQMAYLSSQPPHCIASVPAGSPRHGRTETAACERAKGPKRPRQGQSAINFFEHANQKGAR